MKKYWVLILTIAIVALYINAGDHKTDHISSTGAPPANTGAPGELTCARSGCHFDHPLNSGKGLVSIIFNQEKKYKAGQTYPITVSIEESEIKRFGFEVVILEEDNSNSSGTIELTDNRRTQIFERSAESKFRNYLTYTANGTLPVKEGRGEWTFNWIAPESEKGPITIYLAALSANDDATDYGDYTYTTSLKLYPESFYANKNKIHSIEISKNGNEYNLSWIQNEVGVTKIRFYDLSGKIAFESTNEIFEEGLQNSSFEINNSQKIYLAEISVGNERLVKKVLIQ